MKSNTSTSSKGEAMCRTCGASGPPWNHIPSVLDHTGIGDPGHRINDNQILECINCHKRTIYIESESRNFNTGFCAYCGCSLELITDNRVI